MFTFPLDIPVVYQNFLHSHSHFAILGWIYNILYIAMVHLFVKDEKKLKKYNFLFWVTQVSIVGMLFTFAWQGYAAFSIAFSTLHIFCSYVFIIFMVKDLANNKNNGSYALKFFYSSLFFLFLSSFGPWGIVAVVLNGLAATDLYKQAIYFYLHFQYNGWFVFGLIGLWLKYFEDNGTKYNEQSAKISFYLLFIATIGAYFLSLLGFKIPELLRYIGVVSAFLQLAAIRYLYKMFFAEENKVFNSINIINNDLTTNKVNKTANLLFRFSLLALFVKFILQLISALPKIGDAAFISREITIGFIHLVVLGVISTGLIGWLSVMGILEQNRIFTAGCYLFISGFVLTEILLFYPALMMWIKFPVIPEYIYLLFAFTLLMLAGVVIIFLSSLKFAKK